MSAGGGAERAAGAAERVTFLDTGLGALERERFLRDVRDGLSAPRKSLPCRWFYDAEGSALFEEICTLEEYALPRVETAILREHACAMVDGLPAGTALVELGSGDSRKTRLLIEALLARQGSLRHAMIDVSRAALEQSARLLAGAYPELSVTAVHAEYREGLARLDAGSLRPKLVAWLGSSVGNFDAQAAARFLAVLAAALGPQDRFLMGADLPKPKAVLDAAYDDARGVTARFNRNVLARINRELGGHFDLERFAHRAFYDPQRGRVEMHLVSRERQRVRIDAGALEIDFAEGEGIHTEDSYKFTPAQLEAVAGAAGLRVERTWLDPDAGFALLRLARA